MGCKDVAAKGTIDSFKLLQQNIEALQDSGDIYKYYLQSDIVASRRKATRIKNRSSSLADKLLAVATREHEDTRDVLGDSQSDSR